MSTERLVLRGQLKGHGGWVTALCTSIRAPDMLLSASRDKSIIMWSLTRQEEGKYGFPLKRLTGHSHFVQDVAMSSDAHFALTGSWDGTLRLWELETGKCTERFVGHTKDVLTVAFSADNRHIVSGSRDKKILLWNVKGVKKFQIDAHADWVSCVRFSPNLAVPIVVSAGWDNVVRVWNLNQCTLRQNFIGHTEYVNTVAVSPDGSICASGGKDGTAKLWNLNEVEDDAHLATLDAGGIIHALAFSPVRYWLCVATQSSIKIYDLESKQEVETLKPADLPVPGKKSVPIQCISLAWSGDGQTLFAGYTDNVIRVWNVEKYEANN